MLAETIAPAFVIGSSIFGICWGVTNALIIRNTDMTDYSHLVKDTGDDQKTLLASENTN
jgi:hypothetical protein